MVKQNLIALLSCIAFVSASPIQEVISTLTADFCAAEATLVSVASADPSALAFCSTLLALSPVTQTSFVTAMTTPDATQTVTPPLVTVTVNPISTITVSSFITVTPPATTSTSTSSVILTSTSTFAQACLTTDTILSTTLITPAVEQTLRKRSVCPPRQSSTITTSSASASTSTSDAVIGSLTTLAPSMITSICSCIGVQPSTLQVTNTISAPAQSTDTNILPLSTTTLIGTATIMSVTTVPCTVDAPVPTIMTTVTSTFTSVIPTATGTGLNYYAWPDYYDYYDDDPGFDPAVYSNNQGFSYSGQIQSPSEIMTTDGTYCTLPGQSEIDCGYLVVVMQGFLFATEPGMYTISTSSNVDNAFFTWTGDNAYANNWNDQNEAYAARGPNQASIKYGGSTQVMLQAGQFYPVNFIYVNGGGGGYALLSVTTPDGVEHDDTTGMFFPGCPSGPFNP